MKQLAAAMITAGLIVSAVMAEDQLKTDDEAGRINYSLGYQIGADLRRQGVELSPEVLRQGIRHALSGDAAMLDDREMQALLRGLKQDIVNAKARQYAMKAVTTLEEARRYLAENATKEGVVTTASGLQYRVLEAGSGKSPGLEDTVQINYRATRLNGREFDSSYRDSKPASFRIDALIAGLQEGLQLMKAGARWQLYIPSNLGFRRRGGPLEHEVTIYELELVSID